MPLVNPTGNSANYSFALGLSTAGSFANNTVTVIPYDTVVLDNGSGTTTGSGAKYTIKLAGVYTFSAMAAVAATGVGTNYRMAIRLNGAIAATNYDSYTPVGSGVITTAVQYQANLALNDVIDVTFLQDSGITVNFLAGIIYNTFQGSLVK